MDGEHRGGQSAEACADRHWAVIDDSLAVGAEPPGLRRLQRGGRGEAMNISEMQQGLEGGTPAGEWAQGPWD